LKELCNEKYITVFLYMCFHNAVVKNFSLGKFFFSLNLFVNAGVYCCITDSSFFWF